MKKAKADNFKGWHLHHRLETHTLDGERRLVDILHTELKASGMYYNRPAEDVKRKMSKCRKGRHWYNNGEINKFYECPPGFIPGRLR